MGSVLFGTLWNFLSTTHVVRGTPHLFGGYLFLWARRKKLEELEGGRKKFIVLNEQLDWSRLRKLWELQGRSDQHFSTTQALFFHNDKHPYFREVHLGVRDSIFFTARESPKTVIVLFIIVSTAGENFCISLP